MKLNSMLLTDFYKTIHHLAYVDGLDFLVSYWTPRMSRKEGIDKVVMFGLQACIKKYLIEEFNNTFFNRPKEEVMNEYKRIIASTMTEQASDTKHLEELYDLGYLPIKINAVEEGSRVNIKTPMFEISNTVKGFGWLVNYLETLISSYVWQPMTSATIAYQYRELVEEYFNKTVSDKSSIIVEPTEEGLKEKLIRGFVGLNAVRNSACGDFSMRGMSSPDSAMTSGAGHLLSFIGTATVPAILWLEEYYNANCVTELVGRGTPSTEHSVMSSYGREGEFDSYKKLITETFPKGNLSIVSDTYDYWNVLTNYLPKLKEDILTRDGKIIIRGDSGNPVDIICGEETIRYYNEDDYEQFLRDANIDWFYENGKQVKVGGKYYSAEEYNADKEHLRPYNRFMPTTEKDLVWVEREGHPEYKGTVEILWEIFGGFINEKGYKVLDPHIGAIYGDSITIERAREIYKRLEEKGFAVNNCTLGIGSFSFQLNSRDTFGFALKATHSIINGKEKQIYKDPKTDNDRFKKSQKGMCYVYKNDEDILYQDGLTIEDVKYMEDNLLKTVFENSTIIKEHSLAEVRNRLHKGKF